MWIVDKLWKFNVMETKAKLDMEHGFMQSIIKNQVDRLLTSKAVTAIF